VNLQNTNHDIPVMSAIRLDTESTCGKHEDSWFCKGTIQFSDSRKASGTDLI